MNRPLLTPDVPIDLSNCDLEPIHIPSSIQPHGMLLAARSSDFRIVFASENAESFLGVAPSYVLERTLPEILGSDAVDSIEHALGHDLHVPKDIRTLTFPLCGAQRFDVTAHRTQGLLCLELELSNEDRRWDLLSSRLEGAMRTLGLAQTLAELCAATAPVIRALTGYDRVMVYKFDADGHGEVVAEDRAPEMEPLLGLHYPATDIPAQARKLYLKQRVRTIVDIDYVPVPLLGNPSLSDNAPLDMTHCVLRSISPTHIEYLQNMGVKASLAISIIVRGELWGMVLAHHRTPWNLAPESRVLCDLLGQLVSLLVGVTQQSDEAEEERQKNVLIEVLATSIGSGLQLEQSLVRSGEALLALVGADGVIFRISGTLILIGKTPGPEEASSLLTAFQACMQEGILSSNEIGAILPEFSHLATSASGGLLVALEGRSNAILWLRGQMAETVRWAGHPDASKHLFEGSFRLSPRKSFALWEQTQLGRSIPWRAIEIEAALHLERMAARALMARLTLDLSESHKLIKGGALQAAIFNSANFSSIATDAHGVIQIFNVGAERMLGYDAAEVMNKLTPADISDSQEIVARAGALSVEFAATITPGFEALVFKAARGIEDIYELTYIRKDGSRFPAVVSVTALRDINKAIIGYLLIGTDNSARKRAEEELIKAGALQAAIFNSANFSSIATDAQGVIQIFNVGAERMLGYDATEVMNKLTPADISDSEEIVARAGALSVEFAATITPGFEALVFKAARGIEDIYELTYIRKDGSRFPAVVSVTALRDSDKAIIGYLLIGTDNSARKRAGEALRLAERSLHDQALILDMAGDAVFIRDGEDRITYWNQGAHRLYGWSKEEALGHVIHLLLKTQFPQPIGEINAQRLSQGNWKGELVHARRDGSLITVSSSWTNRYDESTQSTSVLEINQDITARKEVERELESNRLEKLKGSLRLQAVNKELEEFAYVASHDLKAPLRVIDNASKWLEEDLAEHLTTDTRETMKLLRGRVQRMERLLDDLLEYARIGRTPEGSPGEAVAGDILVNDVLSLLPTGNFTITVSPGFSGIQLVRMPLQRILSNLIGNAIKHHDKPQGCIEVVVKDSVDFYEFAVRDDGPGIPAQFHDQIFKMFRTLRPRDQVEGSGMGLAMARKTVELFGGVLGIESNPGQGSTFRFTWPKEQRTIGEEGFSGVLDSA